MTQAIVSMASSGQGTLTQLPVLANVTATLTKNADTTLEDIPGLAFIAGAGETWVCIIYVTGSSAATPDSKWGCTMSGSGTAEMSVGSLGQLLADEGGASFAITTNGEYALLLIARVVGASGGDTFQVQFAQNASAASNSTVTAGSIIAYRVA